MGDNTRGSKGPTPQQIKYAHSLCDALALHYRVTQEIAKRDAKAAWGIIVTHYNTLTGKREARLLSFTEYTSKEISDFISNVEVHLDEEGAVYTPAGSGTQ